MWVIFQDVCVSKLKQLMQCLTLCIFSVHSILRQLLQVVFEQQLVARDPLNRLQHVVLQRQVTTYILFLMVQRQKQRFQQINHADNVCVVELREGTNEVKSLTCIFWTTLLNCVDRCVQELTRSMARSKFFTYSPYIFMNGASF